MTSISILIGAIALCCVPVTPFSFNYAAWKIALPFFGTSVLDRKRSDLKKSLIDACKENMNAQKKRLRIESILDELAGTQSDSATAASPLLRKTWNLIWTTEKEINFFIDNGISSQVSQTISSDAFVLSNAIDFSSGGGLFVTGTLTTDNTKDANPQRTYFKFVKAQLVTQLGNFSFPPVGQGWFDTIYLDQDLRCDRNSRNDILICTCN